ncbi:hypothetical protein GQR58_029181 [Nymphon striatum]|nr:hypothetical protein GQR58_029181 [Nymphon striatum]
MPTVFRHDGFRFFFYSNEGNPREPVHIHAMKAGAEAKFWVEPDILLESSNGFDARTRHGVTISAESIRFDNDSMWVNLSDGRIIGVPLVWFPRLMNATELERADYSISQNGLHWENLDEDISVAGLLAGKGDQTKSGSQAA